MTNSSCLSTRKPVGTLGILFGKGYYRRLRRNNSGHANGLPNCRRIWKKNCEILTGSMQSDMTIERFRIGPFSFDDCHAFTSVSTPMHIDSADFRLNRVEARLQSHVQLTHGSSNLADLSFGSVKACDLHSSVLEAAESSPKRPRTSRNVSPAAKCQY
jgi:hypothetical protein